MPIISNGETQTVRGTIDVSGGTLTLKDGQIPRAKLTQEDLVDVGIPLSNVRVWDSVTGVLPGTAAADDLAIITGTFGTDSIKLQTSDAKAASGVTQYGRFEVALDDAYVLGETLQMRIRAGMNTTISDGTATVDLEVYAPGGDGTVGSDLCTTAAQSINSLTLANKDFTVSAGALVRGDVLDCRVTVAIDDEATATAVIGEITAIKLRRDIKG